MFPAATRHMLVVQFGGRVWVECTNSAANVGDQITDVFVGVNDQVSLYGDNTGTFDIVITGYSQ